MNLRGKEVYVITGVIVVVVAVAWFFLLFKPLLSNVSAADAQLAQITTELSNAKNVELPRLQSYQKTAPQTQSDLLRLNKMLPGEQGIPSVIVEITQTAQQSGLDFVSIQPSGVAVGSPFGLETISLSFTGRYYDLEDFLFRLESYVEYRNNAFLVTGRLLQVSSVQLAAGPAPGFPNLAITISINAFLWATPQSYSGGSALPQITPTASPTPVPGATTTGTPTPGVTGTPTPTFSPTPTESTTP
jgi:Pilus assembly protein, PilO